MWTVSHRTARESGESLIELLVTVTILGVSVIAVAGAIVIGILMSDIHRKQATAGTTVRDYAEAVQDAVVAGGYVGCATPTAYASPAGFSAPTGYSATVVAGSVKYWNGTAWQATCGTDTGLQQLTLQVKSTDSRASEELVLVLRKPCRLADSPCA
jgi:hypothetical protein